MERLLILEDDLALGEGVRLALQGDDRPVTLCRTLAQARQALEEAGPFALLILDVNLPDGSGLSLLEEVKGRVPVILLTANDLETDIVAGLELGAEDYITKPFSLAVLLAKTQALIRRGRGCGSTVTCGVISLDIGNRTCTAAGRPVKLAPREYDLLLCLMRNRGQVLTREQLLDKVWGIDFEGEDRAVDVRIRSLRAALGEAGGQIKTVFKTGYRLEEG